MTLEQFRACEDLVQQASLEDLDAQGASQTKLAQYKSRLDAILDDGDKDKAGRLQKIGKILKAREDRTRGEALIQQAVAQMQKTRSADDPLRVFMEGVALYIGARYF